MSKLKKGILAIMVGAVAALGVLKYQDMQLDKPTLIGHCFLSDDQSTALIFDQVVPAEDENGKTVDTYGVIVMVGPLQIPRLFDIRKANEGIKKQLKEGNMIEVNCETGQPLSK